MGFIFSFITCLKSNLCTALTTRKAAANNCVKSRAQNTTLFHSNTFLTGIHRLLNMKKEDQQDATIRCLLLTSVSTCFGHHYAHLQENKGPVTAFGVLFWICWMWLVAVVGRCLAGCEHCWMWLVAVVGRCLAGCEH